MGVLSIGEINLQHSGLSADLSENTSPPAPGVNLDGFRHGAGAMTLVIPAIIGPDKFGVFLGMFDALLFDRIIVIPRSKDFGFMFSDQQFTLEVWNAFHTRAKTLNGIAVSGGEGVVINDPYGVPVHYAGSQSRTYTVTVYGSGAAEVNNAITFNLAGIIGADCKLTGTRLAIFSLYPNWDEGLIERYGYLTDVLAAYDDTEQRIQLRNEPIRGLAYKVNTTEARENALLEALLWGWQHRVYGVPWWMDIVRLTQAITAGNTTVYCTTTDRDFTAGGLVLIWKDAHAWEAFVIESVNGGQITITAPAQNSYAIAGTWVIPLRKGRLESTQAIKHLSNAFSELEVDFSMEAV